MVRVVEMNRASAGNDSEFLYTLDPAELILAAISTPKELAARFRILLARLSSRFSCSSLLSPDLDLT